MGLTLIGRASSEYLSAPNAADFPMQAVELHPHTTRLTNSANYNNRARIKSTQLIQPRFMGWSEVTTES